MDDFRCRLLAIITLLACVVVVPSAAVRAQSGPERIWLLRSFEKGWDDVWREQRLAARATRYAAVLDDGEMVLEADSRSAASGLWRRVSIDAPVAGRLSWRWKIEHVIPGGRDERRKAGDDYAARVFVVFGGEFGSRKARAICYVWAAREPVGSMYRSPYLEQVATIVVQ
ncbi:MAG: DUF3047 domain-containing protein, partial [Gemmatimonadales bacterium]|nr:DUF3047 domain-containing protein [Gemmatimonadales bacterium]NIN13498.1 DUF3047 domain-containing protein [Gemmatimonadales bacterium]NIN51490.1 DUF3047 domain-containing protein [Gemmatimonadales bacterium]NIP08954.1 DUF3047 domain-containing protein [Gemmatimonadales bacterium]NIR03632.1 DUF3047 domain-containing protein [Gemmatimonadales bacterium]